MHIIPTRTRARPQADDAEIQEAGWFEWRPFLEAWRSRERPMGERKVPMDELLADRPEKRRVVNLNLLKWLDTYESGKGMPCKIKRSTQADKAAAKVAIGW